MSNDPTDLSRHKKVDDHNSTHPAARPPSFYDAIAKTIQNTAGDLTNQIVGAATHTDLAQKFSEPINSQLARQYIKGRAILQQRQIQGKDAGDIGGLNIDDARAVQAYQKVHSDLPAKIPFVDRDALVREVERHIEAKAKNNQSPGADYLDEPASNKTFATKQIPPPERTNKLPPPPTPKEQPAAKVIPAQPAARESSITKVTPASPAATEHSITKVTPASPAAREPSITNVPPASPAAREPSISKAPVSGSAVVSIAASASARDSAPNKSIVSPPVEKEFSSPKSAQISSAEKEIKEVPQPHTPATLLPAESSTLRTEMSSSPAVGHGLAFIRTEHQAIETFIDSQKLSGSFMRAVPRQDSRILRTISELQVIPFGRQFGRTEKFAALVPEANSALKITVPTNAKTVSLTDSQSSRVQGARGQALSSSNIPAADKGVGQAGHVTPPSRVNDNLHSNQNAFQQQVQRESSHLRSEYLQQHTAVHAGTASHTADPLKHQVGHEIEDQEEHQIDHLVLPTISQVHHHRQEPSHKIAELNANHIEPEHRHSEPNSETHHETPADTHTVSHTDAHSSLHVDTKSPHDKTSAAKNDSVNSSAGIPARPIRVVDTKGVEVSPFAKDHNDLRETDEDNDGAPKTYVLKGPLPDKQYITGAELAFVAIMALASASRVRP